MRAYGLSEPLVWNKRTGNVVGGNHRLSIMDELNRGQDYELDVAVVDLPLDKEKELNVALNNPLVQGEFDFEAVGNLLRQDSLDAALMGFEPVDVAMYIGPIEQIQASPEDLGVITERPSAEDAPDPVAPDPALDGLALPGDREAEPGERNTPDEIAEIERRKREYADRVEAQDRADFYCIVVFANDAERRAFSEWATGDPENPYADGRQLAQRVGLEFDTIQADR